MAIGNGFSIWILGVIVQITIVGSPVGIPIPSGGVGQGSIS